MASCYQQAARPILQHFYSLKLVLCLWSVVNYFIRPYYQDQTDWNDCKTLRYVGARADIKFFSDLVGVLRAEREGGSGVCIMSTMMNVTICHCYVSATQI